MGKPQAFAGRVIFDHLPKTAGQAVNAWLTKSLGYGCVTPNLIGVHRDLIRRYGGEYSVISAHVGFEGDGIDPRYRYMTTFREPIDRAISWLFYVLPNYAFPLREQAERFVASQGEELDVEFRKTINNPYVDHFANVLSTATRSDEEKLADALSVIEQYDVWGFYEEMPAFLADVAALIGLPAPKQFERVNVTRGRPSVEQINPLLRKRLEELNTLDLELCRALRERWQREQIHRTTISLPEVPLWAPYNPVLVPLLDRAFTAPGFTILSVALEGGDTFSCGHILRFELEFSLAVAVADLVIGIHVFDEDGRSAFCTNTAILERPLLHMSRGTHRMGYYLVADLPEGQYTAGFAFIERCAEGNRELAWYDKLVTFRVLVQRLTPSVGYVSLPVEFVCWKTSDIVTSLVEDAAGTLVTDALLGDVAVGEALDMPVRLENASAQTWVSTVLNPIYLSYHWLDQTGNSIVFDGECTPLPVLEVLPGQKLPAQMRVVAPREPGRYRLVLVPVQEKRCWFDERGFTPGVLEMNVVAQGAARRYPGADVRLPSQVGRREKNAMVSSGREGFLLFGPYTQLPIGRYVARLEGKCESGTAGVWLDVACGKGTRVLARQEVGDHAKAGWIAELPFELAEQASDVEVRFWVAAETRVRVEAMCIMPVDTTAANEQALVKPEKVAEVQPETSAPRKPVTSGIRNRRMQKKFGKKPKGASKRLPD